MEKVIVHSKIWFCGQFAEERVTILDVGEGLIISPHISRLAS